MGDEVPLDDTLDRLRADIIECRACPRLVDWRERVAREKRAAYRDEVYWGRPVPGFGDPNATVLVVGLAPAAHGANRTGRMFTGDRSGDFLYSSLFRTGFANQPTSERLDDGLGLDGIYITAPVRCAPPANKPTPAERDNCRSFLRRELALLDHVRVIVPLGQLALSSVATELGIHPRPKFAHGLEITGVEIAGVEIAVLASYHVSQQNTFTGRLTEPMLDAIWVRARELAEGYRVA